MKNNVKNKLNEDWFHDLEQNWFKDKTRCPICSSKLVKKYEGWVCPNFKCLLRFKLERGWVYLDGNKKNSLQFFQDKYNFDIESFENKKKWLRLKEEIYNERGRECEICGSQIGLNVHHILPRSEYPSLNFDKENLIILCKDCHKKMHEEDKHHFK